MKNFCNYPRFMGESAGCTWKLLHGFWDRRAISAGKWQRTKKRSRGKAIPDSYF